MLKKNVAIIGAGITGLTAAFYLKRNGIEIHLFDSAEKTGGQIQTQSDCNFVWETGPCTGTLGKPEAAELFEDLEEHILETADPTLAKNRYIWKSKKLYPLPSSLLSGISTPLFSWKDKFGILLEPFRPKGDDPEENLASLVKRRLGNSFLDYAADPFVSGVYASTPDSVIPKYALPKLYALERNYGSFILGSLSKIREPKSERDKKATKKIFSANGGLSVLIKNLTDYIGSENISLKTKKLCVSHCNEGFSVSEDGLVRNFSHVIFAGGANRIPEAFPFLTGKGLDKAFAVNYTKVMEVAVGFKKWEGRKLDGFGALVPSKEKRKILGTLFLSSLFKNRAPKGGALLSVFMGGERHPEYLDLTDGEIYSIVKDELTSMFNLKDFCPELFKITRHQTAIPIYDAATPGRQEAFAKAEKMFPGLLLGGNGIGGIGMADRIKQGKELADKISGNLYRQVL